MRDTDRLPEIQDRAAKARAGSVDVDWLIDQLVKARAENQTLGTEKGLLEERFGELVARLDTLISDNAELKQQQRAVATAIHDLEMGFIDADTALRQVRDAMGGVTA